MGILVEAQRAALKAEVDKLPINPPTQPDALSNLQTTSKQQPFRANNYKFELSAGL